MANKKKARDNQELARDVVDKYTHAMSWRQPLVDKWNRFYALYRSYLSDTKYPWQSNLFIPYSFSTIETVAPRMVANKPQIDIMPREEGDDVYAQIMGKVIDYQWDAMDAEDVLIDAVKEMLIYGTSILKVYWKNEVAEKEVSEPVDETFPELGTVKVKQDVVEFDGPAIESIDLYDFFWDPRGVDIESSRWVIHRLYRTYDHLKELENQGVYKNVDLLKDVSGDQYDSDSDKSTRRSVVGIALPEELDKEGKKYIELLEYWCDDKVVTVANRKVIIRDQDNPFSHGRKPFVRIVDQSVPHEFCGIGELEPIETLQYELNQRRNQRMDNVTLVLNRMWKIKNGAGVDEDELISDPGAVIHTNDMNGIEPLQMQDVTGSSYQEETLIKGDIQQTTGVSDFTRGVGSDSLANDTATGISLIQEAGSSRFRLKLRNLESGIKDIGRMMVSMNEQYITEEKVVRIVGDSGVEWMNVKPDDMKSNFDVMVEAGSTLPNNEAVEKKQIMELYQLFGQDPTINQGELKRMVLQAFGRKNIDKLLTPEAPPMMPGAEMMGGDITGGLDQTSMLQSAMSQPQA